MKLNAYDRNLERISTIGDQFISCLWSEGYNTVQPFTLELEATDEYKEKIKPDIYIGRSDRKTLMVVKTVQIKGGKIVASGKQAAACLDDVSFIGTIPAGSVVDSTVKIEYNKSTKFPLFEFAASNLPDRYQHDISHKSFQQLLELMCQDTDMGFRTVRNGKMAEIQFYKPEENPNLRFSELFGNLSIDRLLLSTEKLKNYAIVLGAGEGPNRIRVDVDLTAGHQRRDLIVDARSLTRDDAETEESYRKRLKSYGAEKLLDHRRTWECLFTPLADDFGIRYDLGDVLTVLLPGYGLKIKARVSRFTQKEQGNKISTSIEVGDITIMR